MININKKTAMNKFKFSDIATISTQKKKPTDEDKFHYIGLEHLDSKSLKVTRYGADVAPKGEKLVMKKGDVLFGKRRAYQKKVAIAPFDGIFSAHGMILRPNEKVISRELFPFFISSDAFLDKAIKISVGSLSPTINNSDIKKLEFELPDIREQEKYSNALFAINDTKEAYINLIGNLDKIQKSRFIELFGDPRLNNKKLPIKKIKDFAKCIAGATPSTAESSYWDNGTIPWMSSGEVNQGRIYSTEKKITQKGYDNASTKLIPPHTVVIAMAGQGKTRGTVGVAEIELCTNQSICSVVTDDTVDVDYLYYFLKLQYEALRGASNGAAGRGGLNLKIIGDFPVIVPDLNLQKSFVKCVNQIDKSKFNLKCAITELDNLSDKIKSEIFS